MAAAWQKDKEREGGCAGGGDGETKGSHMASSVWTPSPPAPILPTTEGHACSHGRESKTTGRAVLMGKQTRHNR